MTERHARLTLAGARGGLFALLCLASASVTVSAAQSGAAKKPTASPARPSSPRTAAPAAASRPATPKAGVTPKAAAPVDDAASYLLYATLVDAAAGGAPNAPVLQLETVVPPASCTSLDRVADAWKPAAKAFATANPGPRPLVREQVSRLPFIPVASADIRKAVASGWDSFRATYKGAGGYVGVSAAGLDPGQTRAILWVTYTCGPSCGSREFRFFTKAGSSWREEPTTHAAACPEAPAAGSGRGSPHVH